MMEELSRIPPYLWALIAIALFTQSSWLFRDAQRRNTHPWLWGIWGLIHVPTPLIVYLLVERGGAKCIAKKIKSLFKRDTAVK